VCVCVCVCEHARMCIPTCKQETRWSCSPTGHLGYFWYGNTASVLTHFASSKWRCKSSSFPCVQLVQQVLEHTTQRVHTMKKRKTCDATSIEEASSSHPTDDSSLTQGLLTIPNTHLLVLRPFMHLAPCNIMYSTCLHACFVCNVMRVAQLHSLTSCLFMTEVHIFKRLL